MEIISVPFALSALSAVIVYYLIRPGCRVWFLVLISAAFIAGYNYLLLGYLLLFALANYLLGIGVASTKYKKSLYRTGIVFNLLQITLLKYASFAVDPLFEFFGTEFRPSGIGNLIIPLGISYFTLQGIGYLINVKMNWEKPERNFLNFFLYLTFFPRFLSGPIDRSNLFLPQLRTPVGFSLNGITDGLKTALGGFFKKLVIANQIGQIINATYADIGSYASGDLWIIFLLQPLYLYFDFSGYTDIAIGFAKMLGLDIPPNFNRPFLAGNVTSFWKRFHMSLSSWFNDYVFKQTSFKYRRWGKNASVFAVFVTFILFGIWHGAGWNFMLLGLIQAIAINYEYFTKPFRVRLFSRTPLIIQKLTGRLLTYLFFALSLVFFFSGNIDNAFEFISLLAGSHGGWATYYFSTLLLIALTSSIAILAFEWISEDHPNLADGLHRFWSRHTAVRLIAYYCMLFMVLTLIGKNLTFVYQAF